MSSPRERAAEPGRLWLASACALLLALVLSAPVQGQDLVIEPAGTLRVPEGGSRNITLTWNNAASVTLYIFVVPSSQRPHDFIFSPRWITLRGSGGTAVVQVSAKHDDDAVNDVWSFNFIGDNGPFSGRTQALMDVIIVDDDAPAILTSPGSLRISENGSGRFSVKLSQPPSEDVTVTLASDNTNVTVDTDSAQAGNQTTLTFTPANYQTDQIVTVSAAEDDDSIHVFARITLSASGGSYDGVTGSVDINAIDDELQRERATVQLPLAEVIGGILSSTQEAIGLRWGAQRVGRSTNLAGGSLALNRPLPRDLAGGFTGHHSGDRLGSVPLHEGRPVRSSGDRLSSSRTRLLSDFSYALNPELGNFTGWAIWGRSDNRDFSGSLDEGEYEGAQSSSWFGIDHRDDGGVLSGLAYSSNSTEIEFTMEPHRGLLKTDISTIMPYIEIAADNGATGRILIGLGNGDAILTRTNQPRQTADLNIFLLTLAGSRPAIEFDNSTLSWSGDLGFGSLKPEDTTIWSVLASLNTVRLRIRGGMQLMHDGFGSSWTATPRLALLLRQDSGDGDTGSGVEITAGMQLVSTYGRLSLDINTRVLAAHSAKGYSDSGSSLQLRLNTRTDGMGFAFTVGPHWGSPESDLLRRAAVINLGEADRRGGRGVLADIAYALHALGGVLTPYSEYRLTGGSNGFVRQAAGVRFSSGETLQLSLFSERLTLRRGEPRSRLAVELHRRF